MRLSLDVVYRVTVAMMLSQNQLLSSYCLKMQRDRCGSKAPNVGSKELAAMLRLPDDEKRHGW